MNEKKKILMVANVDWFYIMHRLSIGKKAKQEHYEVVVIAKDTGRANEIKDSGLDFVNIDISRFRINFFLELKLILKIFRLYQTQKPSLIYHVTMKPVIYGSLITRLLNIKTVNAICGLGYNFSKKGGGLVQYIMVKLMKIGFNTKNSHLLFENKEDYKELCRLGVISSKNKISFTKGIGADLEKFKPQEIVNKDKLVVVLPTRMLWDKGIREFVEAARLLEAKYFGKVCFKLIGMVDNGNKDCVSETYLKSIEKGDYLKWEGFHSDMVEVYKNADIVVLPSYYKEGVPTVLIEACAMGKPIVTTDANGCRECVEEGLNGYKVPVKSVQELADAIEKLINSPEDRKRMGNYSRIKAEKEFDQKDFLKLHMSIFDSMLNEIR
ncbi:glycosyltransferase family 4 protein [Flavobacterium sp. NG2]|uniref:glycosyltransferase family 4 protein n=1 Tax=Flavobacterium sp. NG2 TaxID=3097547 RepID=UPI002A827F68|nr:glycosyltransferase family 4 protein [Flavobacterium sp. NG2]WPR71637.1 glycosyltransferase family 4 protein [Flavobacterium sp. NG2]